MTAFNGETINGRIKWGKINAAFNGETINASI